MNLEDYRKELDLRVKAFHEYYCEHAKHHSKAYPLVQELIDWDEQFLAFLDLYYGVDQ